MAATTTEDDVEEYIELFEIYVEDLKIDGELWMSFLRPLLNTNCRDALLGLPAHKRNHYETVRELILDQCGIRHSRLGDTFCRFQRSKGETFGQVERKLQRLLDQFMREKKTKREALDVIWMEKILQMLPLPAATHVRDKNSKSAMEAAKFADLFFADRHSTPDHPHWMTKPFQARQDLGDFTKRYFQPDLNGQYEVAKDDQDLKGRQIRDLGH